MDIAQFNLSGNAEAGFALVIKNPFNNKPTDAVFHIVGSDSKVYRKARTDAVRLSATGGDLDPDEISARVYAACVTGWENVTKNGEPVEFSKEAAQQMFEDLPWLMDQVGTAIETRSNFTKPVEKA